MRNKEKTENNVLSEHEKLDETFKCILESSKEELTSYLENEQPRIEKETVRLKNRIEDLILTYLDGDEISEAEEALIDSKESDEEFKKLFIQTIYSEIVFAVIYQLISNIDKEEIKKVVEDVIANKNITESLKNTSNNIYDIYDNIFSDFKNNQTMQFIWDLILKKAVDGKSVVVKVDKIEKSSDDEDDESYKFQA